MEALIDGERFTPDWCTLLSLPGAVKKKRHSAGTPSPSVRQASERGPDQRLLDYALGLDTTVGGSTGTSTGVVEESGLKYLTLSYTKPTGSAAPTDILDEPERTTSLSLNNWSSSVANIVPHSVVTGPDNLETVTVRSTHPIRTAPREFLRLKGHPHSLMGRSSISV